MALGSQKWKGNCADLVKQPISTSTVIPGSSAEACTTAGSICDRRSVPVSCPSSSRPASSARPPAPVSSSACRALRRLFGSSWVKPMSRNDVTVVSSQNTNSAMASSAVTRPSMDTMNSVRYRKNRPMRG